VKYLFLFLILLPAFLTGVAQNSPKTIPDSSILNQEISMAEWMTAYDEVASLVSDSLRPFRTEPIQRLSTPGFCLQDANGLWHIVFGKTENGRWFTPIFDYSLDSSFLLSNNLQTADTVLYSVFSHILWLSAEKMKGISDSAGIHLNQYIRRISADQIEVWILPAFQPSGQAVYGGEWKFIYTFSESGQVRLQSDLSASYFSGFKGVWIGQPRELWLNYRDAKSLTPGSIIFAWNYKDFFSGIHINTETGTTSLRKNKSGKYSWEFRQKLQSPSVK
jgi:hypothetical protein